MSGKLAFLPNKNILKHIVVKGLILYIKIEFMISLQYCDVIYKYP